MISQLNTSPYRYDYKRNYNKNKVIMYMFIKETIIITK